MRRPTPPTNLGFFLVGLKWKKVKDDFLHGQLGGG